MPLYLNRITNKTVYVNNLSELKGNIVSRGLTNDYIILDTIALEYTKLINSLRNTIDKGILDGVEIRNIKKGIKDIERFMKEDKEN